MASTRFEATSRSLFFKSPRPHDPRIGEIAMPTSELSLASITPGLVLLGYPDDEGIRVNYGRVGSRDAPDTIRSVFYKLTPGRPDFPSLYDIGNLKIEGQLRDRQEWAREMTAQIFGEGHRLLSLGGGHDWAYPDIAGFLAAHSKQRPIVVNFDAHLDMRNNKDGPNSGSAFYQLLEEFANFDLVQIGAQPFCNSLEHFAYAEKKNVTVHTFHKAHGHLEKVMKILGVAKRPLFLSVDIDVFSSNYAPGASASYPIGLDPHEFLQLMPWMTRELDIRGVGIYEVSPPLDESQKTSKLAALILHSFLLHTKK